MTCPVCRNGVLNPLVIVGTVPFLQCSGCDTILADNTSLIKRAYNQEYWLEEVAASKERAYSSSIFSVSEVFCLSQRPIRRFLDLSCGCGYLLDSVSALLPNLQSMFHGIEPFPPEESFRSKHPNYIHGFLEDIDLNFDGGVCIEVIEHIFPDTLRNILASLAARSNRGALYYFNSAQPSYVLNKDPGYLDPHKRGHIASYSIKGLASLFSEYNFSITALPGRDWGFFAEYHAPDDNSQIDFDKRIWSPLKENLDVLNSSTFGEYFLLSGVQSIRACLESDRASFFINYSRELEQSNM